MRILALVPNLYDTSPAQRFRIEQWEPLLKSLGVEIKFDSFESKELKSILYLPGKTRHKAQLIMQALIRRYALLPSIKKYDAVYIVRESTLVGPALIERLIHRAGVPIIFDFDDAIFLPNSSDANRYWVMLKAPKKTRTICQLASHVIAGNSYLADYARQVNQHVTVVPTTIDTNKYTVEPRKSRSDELVIGWSGSRTTVKYLEMLSAPLQSLARQFKFRFRVIGTDSYKLSGVEVEALPWRAETEVDDLRSIDIGVMPLPDDEWAKGKCGLKALQYMALGIPTVSSPVGVNTEIIKDGENGFLAAVEEEWIEKITRLILSKELRDKLGEAGRRTVESQYSAAVHAPTVYSIISSVIRRAKGEQLN